MRRSRPGANLRLAAAAPLTSPPCSCIEPEPKKKHGKKIAKALKKGKKAKAKLTLKLTDEAGNTETEKLSVKLKR